MAEKVQFSKQNAPKFSMDEDFPALPTTQRSETSANSNKSGGSSDAAANVIASNPSSSLSIAATTSSSLSCNVSKANSFNQSTAPSSSASSETGDSPHSVQLLPNNHITNIPNDMIDNQFGMLGLMKLTEIEPSFGVFAPGIDLTKQNFNNLPPPGEMHSSFVSLQADQHMLPPHEAKYDLPAGYRIHHRIADRLPADPPLAKLTDEILFWIFYNLCREEAQLVAAKELYNRNWRYHKKMMRWLTRVPGSDVIREGSMEKSTYYCWDPLHLQKVVQRLIICYADLDDTPTTYQLSSPTLNARIHFMSSNQHQK